MALPIENILDQVVSDLLALGLFERVNQHEPKVAPGNGITAAVWVDTIAPVRSSGLASTSTRLGLNVRLFTSMLAEPQDSIDPQLVSAVDQVFGRYSGDFDLGGTIRNVDLLGEFGTALSAQAGYVSQDGRLYRVFTIFLPLIVNDVWSQVV